jgi:hypothetical protein
VTRFVPVISSTYCGGFNACSQSDIGWGAKYGLTFAIVIFLISILFYALSGGESFAKRGLSLGQVGAFYLLAGTLAGSIVGAARKYLRSAVVRLAVGIVAAIPVSVGVSLMRSGSPTTWDDSTWVPTALTAIIFGIFGSMIFGSGFPRKE